MSPVYKLTANSVKNGRTDYGSMLAGNTAFIPTDFESIATVSVDSGGSSSIEFASIASTYSHLQIRCIWLHSVTDISAIIRFNSDTAANYTQHILRGNGTAASAATNTTSDGITGTAVTIQATTDAGSVGASIIDILNYANTNKYKSVKTLAGQDINGAGNIRLYSGLWLNTNAISNIKIVPSSGSFNQHSHFALYGIKAAS